MTSSNPPNRALCETFLTAALLSASTRRAEEAVLHAVDMTDLDRSDGDALLANAIGQTLEQPDNTDGAKWLPDELQRVLLLPRELRHCFVSRLLMGLSRERCGMLLGIGVTRVDSLTSMAVLQLSATFTERSPNQNGHSTNETGFA